ncbi:MAG TPA: carbamoyltransferase [Puia sp.]|jgi:carbamoyltransferase|nr:carbamoyltransferase [Puia sp.]
MAEIILGISAFYHDSAAALVIDGSIVAAAQEERFTRKKNDSSFPENAIGYVLEEGGIKTEELTAVAFYDKPLLKFERLLETYHSFAPNGLLNFISSVPVWIKEKIYIKKLLRKKFRQPNKREIPILFPEHHLSHAASAYYPSPFEHAAILTIDGVGEWATATISEGKGDQIKICRELRFPHSVGLLYSAFTYYLGFAVNSGEYKLMGLAPFGNAQSPETSEFKRKILSELVDIREDGSIVLNMAFFDFATNLKMTNDRKFASLLGLPRRMPESAITQKHMNLAMAVQDITESIVVALARTAQSVTKSQNLVMAGGVALNCLANSKISDAGIFENIWVQPAAGDAGGAVGAALAAFHIWHKKERKLIPGSDTMSGSYLGPQFSDEDILRHLRKYDPTYLHFKNFDDLVSLVSGEIAEGNVIGWFQDRMEFGPRALGNRSILGDPRNPQMQNIINRKIKFREGFRPFAPAVLLEDADRYFIPAGPSPYMLFVSQLKEEFRSQKPANYYDLDLMDRLNLLRSDFPAITHVDFSSRLQTVTKESNPKFWKLINAFKIITGHGMLINTSFNIRGEPIVCSPEDAFLGFMRTGMDYLVIGSFLFNKKEQRQLPEAVFKTRKPILD